MDVKSFGPAGEKPLDDKSLLVKSSLEIENTWKLIGRYGVPCIISLLGCLLLLFLYLECGNVHIVYPYQQKAFPTFLQWWYCNGIQRGGSLGGLPLFLKRCLLFSFCSIGRFVSWSFQHSRFLFGRTHQAYQTHKTHHALHRYKLLTISAGN